MEEGNSGGVSGLEGIFRLDGKKALVTGGSRGLGYSIAKGLAAFGADVALAARDPKRLEEAKKSLRAAGRRIWTYSFDFSDVKGIPEFFSRVERAAGGLDILVNNAGINVRKPLLEAGDEDWESIMSVNLKSVFALSRCFVEHCRVLGKPGRIINISSLLAESARPGIGIYTASKGAIRQLTKSFAVEFAKFNVTANAIGPGYFATEMNKPLLEDAGFDNWVRERVPLGRWGMPDEIAGAAVFLASEAAGYMNGQTIYVDGGWLSAL